MAEKHDKTKEEDQETGHVSQETVADDTPKTVETHEESSEKEETAKEESTQEDTPKKEDEIDEMTTLHERTIAALSYVSFMAIVPFYLKKDSKFCRFHGKQGLLVAMIFFFAGLLRVLDLLSDLVWILQFVVFVVMGLAALSGKWKKMPWIYEKACQLEDSLSLKTKEEEAADESLKPEQVKAEK